MMEENQKGKTIGIILGALVLFLVFWLLKVNYLDKPTLITVVGEGRINVGPEIVKFTVNLVTASASPQAAIAENNRVLGNVILLLKNNGVEEKDIVTAYVRVVPPSVALGQSQYQAVNTLDVTLRQVVQFDRLFNDLYGQGVQSITNIVFTVENSRDLEKQVVAEAVKDASHRVSEIAKSTGKRVGRMVSIATGEVGEAGALSGETQTSGFGIQGLTSPSQIEIVRQASIVFELR